MASGYVSRVETRVADLLASGTEACLEAAFRTGEYDAAKEMLNAALVQAQANADHPVRAGALHMLGHLMHFQFLDQDLAGADAEAEESLFGQALAIRRELGDMAGTAESLFGIGLVHQILRHDWSSAMPYYRDAMALADRYGNALIRSECHRHIGFYYVSEDIQPEQALRHLRTSLELRRQWGDPRWRPSATFAVGMAELAAGMRADGIDHLRQALQESRDARLSERRIKSVENWLHRAEAGETPG
jgi:tetratricopeptide (TPR) repeat protein